MLETDVNEFSNKETKLLSNIFELLQRQNELLEQFLYADNTSTLRQEKKGSDVKPCKYCGGTHKNKGEFLACSRKNKKEDNK